MNLNYALNEYRNDEGGATAVEFSIIIMAFLMLVIGIMEASHALWVYNGVRNATEKISREALVQPDLSDTALEDMGKESLQAMQISPEGFTIETETVEQGEVTFKRVASTYEYTSLVSVFLPESMESFTIREETSRPLNWGD